MQTLMTIRILDAEYETEKCRTGKQTLKKRNEYTVWGVWGMGTSSWH